MKNKWPEVEEAQQKIHTITEGQSWETFITQDTYQSFINFILQLALTYYQKFNLRESANLLRKAIIVHLQFSEFDVTAPVLKEIYTYLRQPYENQINTIEFRLYDLAINILGGGVKHIYDFNDFTIIYDEIVGNIASQNATKYQILANDLKVIMQYLHKDLTSQTQQLPDTKIKKALQEFIVFAQFEKRLKALDNINTTLLQLASQHPNTAIALANQLASQNEQINQVKKRIETLEEENARLKAIATKPSEETKKRGQTVLTEFFKSTEKRVKFAEGSTPSEPRIEIKTELHS